MKNQNSLHLQRQRKEAMKMMMLAIVAVMGFFFLIFILPELFILSFDWKFD
jgi:hypothetical protein